MSWAEARLSTAACGSLGQARPWVADLESGSAVLLTLLWKELSRTATGSAACILSFTFITTSEVSTGRQGRVLLRLAAFL